MPRKVLFISVDQMRADHAGFAGHTLVRTPTMDALADEGTVFNNHFTNTAPCGPARATMLTGLYPMTHRSVTNGTPLDARFTNIALEVRKMGIEPVLFGYTDSSVDPRTVDADDPRLKTYEGVLPGFIHKANLNLEGLDQWLAWLEERGYDVPANPLDIYTHVGISGALDGFSQEPARYKAAHSDMAFLADQAIDYLETEQQNGWFVHLVFLRPHPPLIAPEPYNTMYDWQDIDLPPEDDQPAHPLVEVWRQVIDDPNYFMSQVSMAQLSDDDVRKARAVYMGLITEVDHHIGRVIDTLKRTRQWDDTLVIVTSDHGEELGAHGLWGKGGFYDGSYHVPLIIRDPRTEKAARIDQFTEHVDLAPTILHWLDRDVPYAWDGLSLLPFVRGDMPATWRDGVFMEFDWRFIAPAEAPDQASRSLDQHQLCIWRDAQYKYVHFIGLPPVLFDLKADPGETTDLAGDPAHAATRANCLSRILEHRMTHAERELTHIRLG